MSACVVIGNAEPKIDISKEIEGFNYVVRFNHTPYLKSGLIGHRTDILVIQCHDKKFAAEGAPLIGQSKTAIVARRHDREKINAIVKATPRGTDLGTMYSDGHPLNYVLSVPHCSAGTYLIYEMVKRHNRVTICCFTWEGWSGHAWKKEKEYAYQLRDEGRIVIL